VKITFVYPDILEIVPDYKGAFYMGIAILSAVLKREGHETSLIHITDPEYDLPRFEADLSVHQPNLIAFSSTTNGWERVRHLAGFLASRGSTIPTIYGGIHPTLAPQECIAAPGIDMIAIGESEQPLANLCRALQQGQEFDKIPNLWVKKGSTVIRNPLSPLLQNLDDLPFADRALFDYPNLHFELQGAATIMASRGCPFACTYCCNTALRRLYNDLGSYVRFRSVRNVIDEIKQVRRDYAFVRRVHFDDDILFLRREWAEEFADLYVREVRLPFCCNVHPSLCTAQNVETLARAGCDELRIGIESGNEMIRRTVLGRSLDEGKILEAFALARSKGMRTLSFNMVGIPDETPSCILESVKLNARAGVDEIQLTAFHPYPGSALYEVCLEKGMISKRRVTSYYVDSILDLPDLSREQLRMFQRYFCTFSRVYRKVFRLPTPVRKAAEWLLDGILTSRMAPSLLRGIRPIAHRVGVVLRVLMRRNRSKLKCVNQERPGLKEP